MIGGAPAHHGSVARHRMSAQEMVPRQAFSSLSLILCTEPKPRRMRLGMASFAVQLVCRVQQHEAVAAPNEAVVEAEAEQRASDRRCRLSTISSTCWQVLL